MNCWMVSARHATAGQIHSALSIVLHCTPLEILDFGYPQNSEIDALKMYITTESIKSEMAVVSEIGRFQGSIALLTLCLVAERRLGKNHHSGYGGYIMA